MQCAKSFSIADGHLSGIDFFFLNFVEGPLSSHASAVRACSEPAESISHLHDELRKSIILFPAYCKASRAIFFPARLAYTNLVFLAFCMSDPFIHHDLFLIQNQVLSTTCKVHFYIEISVAIKNVLLNVTPN